jgi:DNA replication and repair protein RecF
MGVHKDDLEFILDGYPVKKFGSQGQQKSFVIAIKLAQFDYTRNIKGFKPILLLDDVFDKLDDLRVSQLIKLVSENSFGQVFITDTSRERIISIFDAMEIDHEIFDIPHRKNAGNADNADNAGNAGNAGNSGNAGNVKD